MRFLRVTCVCAALVMAVVSPAWAQSGANVLVVANENSADSVRIAGAYLRSRAVPQEQLLRIKVDPAADEVDRNLYDRDIQTPIGSWLASHSAQDRILYIVLTKGVPLRIKGTVGRNGTVASVDSELTLLYRRMVGGLVAAGGSVPNPYYAGAKTGDKVEQGFRSAANKVGQGVSPALGARLFSHADQDIYLVTRVDGYTVDDALAIVERGAKPSHDGKIVLDAGSGLADGGGDRWLKAAADWMKANGFGDRVVHDETTRVVTGEREVLGYYSWGSNDSAIKQRSFAFTFVPGAVAGMFVSTDARTLREPPATWKIGTWNDRSTFFAGSPQSLIGDLIREGVTGVSGYVAEPYLDATVRPDILFPAYLSGFNLAESYYAAMPVLSWQAVVVGDPLCAPFARPALDAASLDKGLDQATELPAYFSTRRLQSMMASGGKPEALKAMLRAEARTAKGDKAGMRQALEEAATIDPRLSSAQMLLGMAYEETKQHDAAIERYRRVLDLAPQNAVALNNLAYALAVRKNQPAEALGYAERAFAISPTPTVADTLAWVQHLLGRDQDAVKLVAVSAAALPANAEIRMHAAVVRAAVGVLDVAEKDLAEALRLDPTLESRPEVAEVRARLKR